MSTDEQLIEHLRSSMHAAATDVYPPSGLLDSLPRPRRRFAGQPSVGGLFTGLSAAIAVAVAGLVIVLLGHGRSLGPPHAATSATRAPGPTTLGELRSELAILRRPQRATDRLPAWGVAAEQRHSCSNCLNVAGLLPRESRLLATIRLPGAGAEHGLERVYLILGTVPAQWQHRGFSGWRQPGNSGRGLHLSLVGLRTSQAQPTDYLLNYAISPMPAQALTPRDVLITSFETVGVVPDGVTRVKWELANPGQTAPVTVYPRVRGNVASAPWTPAPRSTGLVNEQLLISATWYGADGRVIAHANRSLAAITRLYSKGGF